jgi:hypothetical protein
MAAILPYLHDSVFDQKDITAMSMAFDDVCKTLDIRDGNPAREVIAERIIALARNGERSPTRLRDRLLREVGLVGWDGRTMEMSRSVPDSRVGAYDGRA